MPESAVHLSRKPPGPELEESTTKNARIRIRTEEFRCEHPAGSRCLGSNRKTTTTAQTNPVCQFDCRTDYRTVWLTPGTRLTDWVECPRQNKKRSFWMNRRDSSCSSSSSDVLRLLLCVFSTWIWFYEEIVNTKTVLVTIAVKTAIVSKTVFVLTNSS